MVSQDTMSVILFMLQNSLIYFTDCINILRYHRKNVDLWPETKERILMLEHIFVYFFPNQKCHMMNVAAISLANQQGR